MFAQLAIGSALLSGSLAARFAPTPSWISDATITPGPRIELLKKQNNARDLGWLLFSGNWEFESCQEGGTYYETASQWGCCATGDNGCAATDLPIGCVDGSLIYPKTGTDISEREATYAWYAPAIQYGLNKADLQQYFGVHSSRRLNVDRLQYDARVRE
jgi:hypothetical protein